MPGPVQSFQSPGYYDREIDQSASAVTGPSGTPAGVIGTSDKGPAFVPVTVGSSPEFTSWFGPLDVNCYGPYAAQQFLKYRNALTFMRVLGAGANSTSTDVSNTVATGQVKNAGFHLDGNAAKDDALGRHNGAVQFIAVQGTLSAQEAFGIPMFTDNSSFGTSTVNIVRGMVLLASGARMMVQNGNANSAKAFTTTLPIDSAQLVSGTFKLIISSTLGNTFANTDGNSGVMIFTASMNPDDQNYYAKVLNTNPDNFVSAQHYLYADFAVDAEIVTSSYVAVLSGSNIGSTTSGNPSMPFRQAFGAFNARYQTPTTPKIISQPFGATEYDLFSFQALDDGAYANQLVKVSITNILASLDNSNQYGTFTVQVRSYGDTDLNPNVLETFTNCSLNPNADNYVAKVIGDRRVTFNFDTTIPTEKRVVTFGKYENNSSYIRVVMCDAVNRGIVPATCLPFGHRGYVVQKTNDSLNNVAGTNPRLVGILGPSVASALSGSIVPPVPYRFKVTKGTVAAPALWPGQPGPTEITNAQFYWGAKFERNNQPLNPNNVGTHNTLIDAYTNFLGISLLDVVVTGSGADVLNNNKFTLSKVALSNQSVNDITSSISNHMKEAAYIRHITPDTTAYTINDGVLTNRITFATILAKAGAAVFNTFSQFTKFTTFLQGGFDGVNILDRDARRLNDKSTSFDVGGGAEPNFVSPGMLVNTAGVGQANSTVSSYLTAINIMTDPMSVKTNILAVPGIREPFITDYAGAAAKTYGLDYFVMDIPSYDDNLNRIYDDSTTKPSITQTANTFDSRTIDNSYAGTYFPDVYINDNTNKRRVKVPSSVAALGAIAFNDKVAYPWFAPAGFNRAALDFVTNVAVRLNVNDRDRLYNSRINPIATFPKLGFVIYGQKTLQIANTTLNRVNVRRMLLEVKRIVSDIALKLCFEQNDPATRNKFVSDVTVQLGLIQAQSGIEAFKPIMNETNNTQADIDANRLNGRIAVVPTRAIEYIAMDFVITQSGITFV